METPEDTTHGSQGADAARSPQHARVLRLSIDGDARGAGYGKGNGSPEGSVRESSAAALNARRHVATENHLAGGLPVLEGVSQAFVKDVVKSLEGGRAAILRPHRRNALIAGAVDKGLRPFQAQLLVAGVQEAVRAGEIDSPSESSKPVAVFPVSDTDGLPKKMARGVRGLIAQGVFVLVAALVMFAALLLVVLSGRR